MFKVSGFSSVFFLSPLFSPTFFVILPLAQAQHCIVLSSEKAVLCLSLGSASQDSQFSVDLEGFSSSKTCNGTLKD